MKGRKRAGKGNTVRVDFTGVEAGGGSVLLPEGPMLLEVSDISQEVGADSGQPYLAFEFEVVEGKYEGKKAWDNFSLQPQSLWKLRGFLEAAGQDTEDGVQDLDLDEIKGLIVTADIVHEDYKGKPKSKIAGYTPAEEEVEKPTPSKAKKKPTKDEDEETIRVKQRVSFKDGKKQLVGKVVSIEDDVVTVAVGDDDEYEMAIEDVTPA